MTKQKELGELRVASTRERNSKARAKDVLHAFIHKRRSEHTIDHETIIVNITKFKCKKC